MLNHFRTAVQYHQSWLLDEAARFYRETLARAPHHADALHLLGVVAFQQGDLTGAAELIGQAIGLRPDVPGFYANLAEVLRAGGQLEPAAGCCRTALALQPDFAGAANNLGLILLAQGKPAEAVTQFETASRSAPREAMIHNNLGNALRLAGDQERALACFREALKLNPDLAEAHSNLGQLLLERHQRQLALTHCRAAVRLRPNLAEAQNNLGNALRELGQLAEARTCYAEALKLEPELALTWSNMGQALQEEGNLREALGWYQQGLQRDPGSARIHCNLASALEELWDLERAAGHYRLALQLQPGYAEAHNGLGSVLHEQGNYPEALAQFREVLRLAPDQAGGHCNLGNLLEELGNFDEALASFREALRRDPDHPGAWSLLATLLRNRLPAEDLEAIRRLLARPHLPPAKRLALHFGLAHVLDAQGGYTEAAEHLRLGNGLCRKLWQKQGRAYDPQAHTQHVDDLIKVFSREFCATRSFGLDTEVPIFIVGLPRSGTSLTEQILASHSRVHGAGELNYLRNSLDALPAALNMTAPPLDVLPQLTPDAARQVARWHLARLRALNAGAERIVDKMPENYLYLGLIRTLFPRARIIHCTRDLRDVAVSCWMTNFRHIRWAADPDHIAARFRDYQRLMAHWRETLPGEVFEVAYEETVSDLEGVARRLIAWCGLEWEDNCLAFHETARPVRTASVTQVRQPIYTRSVARWKHYEQDLATLFRELPLSTAFRKSLGSQVGTAL
jgi:tetratricopeptide (TPR) repeat protein